MKLQNSAAAGNKVSVIEMQSKITGPDAYIQNLVDVTTRLQEHNVELLPSMKLIEIRNNEIMLQSTVDNNIITKESQAIVLSLGIKKDNAFIEEVEKNFTKVKVIGDASKPGRISDAIKKGFETAYFLN